MTITEPGVYEMTSDAYHADPALSSSGARRLLPPSCPALFKWERDHGQGRKRVFDFGHAAHKMVLGDGPELVVIDADNYRTKAAQEQRDEAYEAGKVPLLPDEFTTVSQMAWELQKHPVASSLRQPGKPEQSLFARDAGTGVMLRARIDWLPDASDERMVIWDLKTTISAEPRAFSRSVATYGYFAQAAFYVDIVQALGLADDPRFLFVAIEKTPPYLVTVFELDAYALEIGRRRNRRAIDIFAACSEKDDWPAYSTDVETVALPAWLDEEEIVIS